jgi:hypothetical protein
MLPTAPPAVLLSEIVAAGKAHVFAPLAVSVNLTGITPRLAGNTLEPSELIGCGIEATYSVNFTTKASKLP